MKIAWLCPYPVSELNELLKGGVRKPAIHPCSWIVNLSRALAKRSDIELHIVTLCAWITHSQTVQRDGMTIHVLKNGIPFARRGWPASIPLDVLSGFASDVLLLRRQIRRIAPDVLHAHGTENPYSIAVGGLDIPAMISMQGIITEICKVNPTCRYKRVQKMEQQVLRHAQYVSCRTAFDTGFVQSVNPKAHIFQIHEAMNPVYFENRWAGCTEKQILFVGSMGKHKGLDYLFQATQRLVKDDPEVKLLVVGGTASHVDACRIRCRELGIGKNVEFAGFLNADQIAPLHRSSRVFVIPSTNENSPNTLAEAMVSGMPCVASAVGGIPSMVDDETTGLLFESGDVDGLTAQLKRVLCDDDLCRRLGTAAAEVARQRHWPDTVAEKTVEAYEFILEDAARADRSKR